MLLPVFLASALIATGFWIADTRRRPGVSPAVWCVVAWLVLLGSRPVANWFGAPEGVGAALAAGQSYDEGNPLERSIYFVLILVGVQVLVKRQPNWRELMRPNGWMLVFFLYWGLSVCWADAPLVAAKRWVKDLGHVVMALLIVTDGRPLEAMKAAFVRCAALLLPLSALLIRFVPEMGRSFHVWTGEVMYTGVTTHKNSLGVLVLVSLIFLVWDLIDRPAKSNPLTPRASTGRAGTLLLVLLGVGLLQASDSATALGCAGVGAALLAGLHWAPMRQRAGTLACVTLLTGLLLWLTGLAGWLMEVVVVDVFGRNPTLTTRTEVWPLLLGQVDNVLLGAGFGGFWTGEQLDFIYGQLGIIQAHNGYLETYLNGGLVGLCLLCGVLVDALLKAHHQLDQGERCALLACTVMMVAMIYNITEASFDKASSLWFAFVLTRFMLPAGTRVPTWAGTISTAQTPRQLGILP
jgi:hypothetical protein